MKFSFEGSFNELHELGLVISGSPTDRTAELSISTKEIADQKKEVILQTPPANDPKMDIGESIAADPCIDPSTGEYFTAFIDMAAALDRLIENDQQSDVKALLTKYSSDGTYGGIPPKQWKTVEDSAKALLKKKSSVTLSLLKELATEYTHSDPKANKPKLKALLDKYGAKGISTVPEEKRSAFYEELKALQEGE